MGGSLAYFGPKVRRAGRAVAHAPRQDLLCQYEVHAAGARQAGSTA